MSAMNDERSRLVQVLTDMLGDRRRVDKETLRAVTEAVVQASRQPQTEIAEALGVSPSSVTHAKTQASTRREQLQIRILQHLTGARVQKEVRYVIDLNPSDQDSQ